MKKILIVEDDWSLNEGICHALSKEGYDPVPAHSLEEANTLYLQNGADMVLLDVNLPDGEGFAFCRQVKEHQGIPVLFLTARDLEEDALEGFDAGADDYITKPFGTSELLARVRTAVRHLSAANGQGAQSHIFEAHGLVIDFDRRRIFVHEQEVHLTQVEYKIVSMLAKNSGRVITYDALISHVWGPYADDNNRILRVNMANIRRKIEKNPAEPEYLFTEVGVGYRMAENTDN